MATQTKTVSGTTTTYTITDMLGDSVTVVVNQPVTGLTAQFSGAAVHEDAINALMILCQLLGTGIAP